MAFILTGGALGALIRLECPFCGEIQARARQPEGALYECRRCHKSFRDPTSPGKESKGDGTKGR